MKISRKRRVIFWFITVLILPLLALVLLEAGLRIGGYGYRTDFFIKYRSGDRELYRENRDALRSPFDIPCFCSPSFTSPTSALNSLDY